MYCLFTCDRLDATSSGSARKGLSAGCCALLLPSAVLPAWLVEAGLWSTECELASPSPPSSPGEDDRDAATLKLVGAKSLLLLLVPAMLQACLTSV